MDITLLDKTFGQLVIINNAGHNKHGAKLVECLCKCGKKKIIAFNHLKNGHTKSCGCLLCPNKDLTNQRFGKLLVLKKVPITTKEGYLWDCLCDCGKSCQVPGVRLRNKNTQSCGCLRIERIKTKLILPNNQSAYNRILRSYKYCAKKRNLIWEISNERFSFLINDFCYYCSAAPNNLCKEKGGTYLYNGIDRINNAKGYTDTNTVTCCSTCNYAKRIMSSEDYISLCNKVASKHKV